MTDHVLAALVRRRSELGGRLHVAQGELQQMHADLASLDAVIRQLDPDYRLETIRPRYQRNATAAEHGSISRTVLDVLRRAHEPLAAGWGGVGDCLLILVASVAKSRNQLMIC